MLDSDVGVLAPLHSFYPSIESFLDTSVTRTIQQATDNAALEQPFDKMRTKKSCTTSYENALSTVI